MININYVSVIQKGQKILNQVSVRIDQGSLVTIVGPSGSGKTTFLRLLNALIDPVAGEISYQGKSFQEWDSRQLRQEIGLVFQKPYLFGELVKDNLIYPFEVHNREVNWSIIEELLSEFNLSKEILEKKIQDLSGGEQQRISMIRSLVLEPKVLLLDEVTASLDPVNTKLVEDFMLKLNQRGVTILMVTHNLFQAERLGEYTLFLKDGQVAKYMRTAELFKLDDEDFQKFQRSQL